MGELDGQVAIVTGGGRGIGRTIAQMLSAAGAAVAVAGRSEGALHDAVAGIAAAGGRAVAVPTDITDRAAVARLVAEVTEQLGPVDLFVANAGVIDPIAPLVGADPDAWWHCFELNVHGTATCLRTVLPGMMERRAGRLIALFGGPNQGMPGFSAYISSKAAVLRLVEILGMEMAPHNVQVFALQPGFVKTDMSDSVVDLARRTPGAPTQFTYTPAERVGEACVYLASGDGDALTGRLVLVSDDYRRAAASSAALSRDELYVLRFRTLSPSSA